MKWVTWTVLVMTLAACGASSSDSATQPSNAGSPPAGKENNNSAASVALDASGAETFTFESNALYGCTQDRIEVFTTTHAPTLRLALPLDIQPGQRKLEPWDGANNSAIMLYVNGEVTKARASAGKTRGEFYSIPSQSDLRIEQLPSQRGEFFTANLVADLQSDDGHMLTVELAFRVKDTGYCSRA